MSDPDEKTLDESRESMEQMFRGEARYLAGDPAAYLTGWYLVSEWMDPHGEKWISRAAHKDSPAWQRQGYLTFALSEEQHEIHETLRDSAGE